jgi:hypothetical protein
MRIGQRYFVSIATAMLIVMGVVEFMAPARGLELEKISLLGRSKNTGDNRDIKCTLIVGN